MIYLTAEPISNPIGLKCVCITLAVMAGWFFYLLIKHAAREDKERDQQFEEESKRMWVVKEDHPDEAQIKDTTPKWKLIEKEQVN
jgi:hypothetical protein